MPPAFFATRRMKTLASRRPLFAVCLLAGLLAVGAAVWSWHQATRPGRAHLERGLDDAAAKQMPQAEQEWLAGVREDPSFPDDYAQLGELYSALGRPGEAAARYRTASRLTPGDGALLLRLARAEEAAGDTQAALDAAGRAAALRPDDADAVGDFGILAAKLNQPQKAQAPLARAHARAPDDADTLIYLVRVEFQLHDLAGAERDLTPFIQRHPDNAETCYLMASLLHQKPLTDATARAALEYARRAQAGAPRNADANVLLGQALLDARQPARALPAFRQAQALAPGSVLALHGLLTCFAEGGRTGEAARTRALLDAALARRVRMGHASDLLLANPSDTAAMLEMARLYQENGEPASAESYYRRAARQAPQDPRARAALAGFLQRAQGHPRLHDAP